MSRSGYSPSQVPGSGDVAFGGTTVTVEGAKGALSRTFSDRISFEMEDGVINVGRDGDDREARALHGLSRALLSNMIIGVSEGYMKELATVGVGYRANLQGKTLELQVGFSHSVYIEMPAGIEFEVPEQTKIFVRGIDKELVGQVAADIRSVRPPEPYKGKGIRYVDEYVRRKAGKAGAVG